MFQIRDGVPVPASKTQLRLCKYPFEQMEVGQHFVVPVTNLPKKGAQSVQAAALGYKRRKNPEWSFAVRELDSGDVGVWRTK